MRAVAPHSTGSSVTRVSGRRHGDDGRENSDTREQHAPPCSTARPQGSTQTTLAPSDAQPVEDDRWSQGNHRTNIGTNCRRLRSSTATRSSTAETVDAPRRPGGSNPLVRVPRAHRQGPTRTSKPRTFARLCATPQRPSASASSRSPPPREVPDQQRALRPQRRLVELNPDNTRDAVHVRVVGEQLRARAPGDRGDHAVEHPPRGHTRRPTATVDRHSAVEIAHSIEAQRSKRKSSRRRSSSRRSSRAPASTSMTTGSVPASEPAARSIPNATIGRAARGPVVLDPDRVSTRITPARAVTHRPEARRSRPLPPSPALPRASSAAPRDNERQIDGRRLRTQAVAGHDLPHVGVLDLDVRPHRTHTPTIHQADRACGGGVSCGLHFTIPAVVKRKLNADIAKANRSCSCRHGILVSGMVTITLTGPAGAAQRNDQRLGEALNRRQHI